MKKEKELKKKGKDKKKDDEDKKVVKFGDKVWEEVVVLVVNSVFNVFSLL